MHIVADENIPLLDEFFAGFGRITRLNGRSMVAADLAQADVLLVRSVTAVNAALLAHTPVQFVGTCTIGTDHVDFPYLQQAGLAFSSAPGCNADAVADYVLSSVLVLVEYRQQRLTDLTVAVVGVGNVGLRVRTRLQALGVRVLGVDPFKTEAEVGPLVSLAVALKSADVLCLHTPLTVDGAHPTKHLIGAAELNAMQPNACVLNAGRGPVVDNTALLQHLNQQPDFVAMLDVWETEPEPNLDLLRRCLIATPHIAGYSLDGKMRGTEQVYQALCRFLIQPAVHQLVDFLPAPAVARLQFSSALDTQQTLSTALHAVYDVRNDDGRMRYALTRARNVGQSFDELRRNYPLRRDFSTLTTGTIGN